MRFRLKYTVGLCVYSAGAEDTHGNPTASWAAPVDIAANHWSTSSTEPVVAGYDRTIVDKIVVVDSSQAVSARDRMVINGEMFEVVALPEDYDHGPYSAPNRKPVLTRRVDG